MSNPVYGYQGMNNVGLQRYKNFLTKNKITKKNFLGYICERVDLLRTTPRLVIGVQGTPIEAKVALFIF